MTRKITAAFMCLALMLTLFSCKAGAKDPADDNKLKVSVTFNAMKEFAEAVGKDKVSISVIIPDGTEPHDFEPKGKDLADLSDADVFIYNGLGMETWVSGAVKSAGNNNLVLTDASDGADVISDGGQSDPHIWISIKGAQQEVINIKNAFVKADPQNSEFYERNCSDFVSQLEELYNEYKPKFASLENKRFVTGHSAFAYLCRDFGLEQNSVENVFAEGEPSPQKLSELADYCKENRVKTVFVESMVSPAVTRTLASEIGAAVKTIYTFESSEDNTSYIDRMKTNLSEIYSSLSA